MKGIIIKKENRDKKDKTEKKKKQSKKGILISKPVVSQMQKKEMKKYNGKV